MNSKKSSNVTKSDVESGNLLAQFRNKLFASSPKTTIFDNTSVSTSNTTTGNLLANLRQNRMRKDFVRKHFLRQVERQNNQARPNVSPNVHNNLHTHKHTSSEHIVQADVHNSDNMTNCPVPIPKPRKLNANVDTNGHDDISLA